MTALIGINGPMTSGKDTAYSFIQEWAEERGVSTCRRGFADLLKWSAYRIFKPDCTIDEGVAWANEFKWNGVIKAVMTFDESDDHFGHEWQITGRQLLQHYGTEAHRDVFDPDFWVNALLPVTMTYESTYRWHDNFDRAQICVITDLRFPNEAERVHELDGFVWVIKRDSVQREEHVSEAELPKQLVDWNIDNNGTLEDFRKSVYALLDDLERERLV
jgi:hypothetical protein